LLGGLLDVSQHSQGFGWTDAQNQPDGQLELCVAGICLGFCKSHELLSVARVREGEIRHQQIVAFRV
jgi:hypothetical protein